jgi:hypothetical protein
MIRLVLYLLVAYIAYRLVRGWLAPRNSSRRVDESRGGRIDDVMVKCPQCGAYFPRRDGIALRRPEGDLWLCSPKCRDAAGGSAASGSPG